MPMWLLEAELCDRIESSVAAGLVPTTAQQAEYEAAIVAANVNGPRIFSTKGDKASIDVQGILTDAPDFMAKLFGGGNTTYSEIQSSIAAANSDAEVHSIEMNISSPGGQASAEWLATMNAVANSAKPVNVTVGSMAASAAYGIASQASKVVAKNEMSMVGSVGAMTTRYIDPARVNITSTNAPNKNPNVSTTEGKAAVVAELDNVHDIFAGTVAKGRKVSVDTVNSKFGKGGMLLATDAVARGMIDGIAENVQHPVRLTSIAAKHGTEGAISMDINKLRVEHPAVYAAVKAEGVTEERDRVVAHLVMGEGTGALATAVTAIKDGSVMTATITASYMTAGLNREDSRARTHEDKKAAEALAAAAASGANGANASNEEAEGEDIFNRVSAQLGGGE